MRNLIEDYETVKNYNIGTKLLGVFLEGALSVVPAAIALGCFPSFRSKAFNGPEAPTGTVPPSVGGHSPVQRNRPFSGNLTDMGFNNQVRHGYVESDGTWTDKGYARATPVDMQRLDDGYQAVEAARRAKFGAPGEL